MKPQYRVEKIDAGAQDMGDPRKLAAGLNGAKPGEAVFKILPFVIEGTTRSFFVVFGPAGNTDQ